MKERLGQANIAFREYPIPGTHYSQIFCQDPDGHHIEFVQVPADRPAQSSCELYLHHISHLTRNLQADLAILQRSGLTPIPRPPFKVDGAWLTNGQIEIHLVVPDHAAEPDPDVWTFGSANAGMPNRYPYQDSYGNQYRFL